MTPNTRLEQYLNRLATDDGIIPEAPDGRTEQYLAYIINGSGPLPEKPETRIEQYLNFIATGSGQIPEPNTRIEQYLNYYATQTGSFPNDPNDRVEKYLYQIVTKEPAGDNFGKIYYYPLLRSFDVEFSDRCTIASIDGDKLASWLEEEHLPTDMLFFDYISLHWECMGKVIDDMSQVGINVTVETGATSAMFMLRYEEKPNTDLPIMTYIVTTEDDFMTLGDLYTTTFDFHDGVSISKNTIIKVECGNLATRTPDHFLQECYYLQEVKISSSIVEIGNNFLTNDNVFNSELDISHVEKIGIEFLSACTSFNQPLDVSNLRTVGTRFLMFCSAFNHPLNFQNLEEITASSYSTTVEFLQSLSSFNSEIKIPKLTQFKSSKLFLLCQCQSFDGELIIPETFCIGQEKVVPFKSMTKSATLTVNCNNLAGAVDANYVCTASKITDEAYTTGIKIKGTYANNFVSRFPNRTTSPYRKLVKV